MIKYAYQQFFIRKFTYFIYYTMTDTNSQDIETIKKALDEQLPKISIKNRYQLLLVIFFSFAWLFATWTSIIGSFVFMNPLFTCDGQDSSTEKQACEHMELCKIQNNYTATYYLGLYCEKEDQRSMIQSAIYLGNFIGIFTLVALSDSKGRKYAAVATFGCFVAGCAIMTIGIYAQLWYIICIGCVLAGMYFTSIATISYVITGQMLDQKLRQQSYIFYCSIWGLAEMLLILQYYFMPQWYNFIILCLGIPSIGMLIISVFFLIQTPQYWLFVMKDKQKYDQSLEMIVQYNGCNQQNLLKVKALGVKFLQVNQKMPKTKVSLKQTMKVLLCNKRNAIICLCLGLCQSAFNIYYYGMQGSMERTGYNFGVSMLLAGIHQFLGYLISSFVLYKFARKRGFIVTSLVACAVGLSFLIPLIKDSQVFQSIMISIARLCSVFGYSFFVLLQMQSFPTQIIATGCGTVDAISQIAKMVVPYLINKMNDMGIHPIILCSVLYLFIGIVPLVFVKETLKADISKNQGIEEKENKKQGKESLLDDQQIQEKLSA